MNSAYLRVVSFDKEEGLLELSEHGLDTPNADVALCMWQGYSDHGFIHWNDTAYSIPGLGRLIARHTSIKFKSQWDMLKVLIT